MSKNLLKENAETVEKTLHEKGFDHLYVNLMADHLIIYSKNETVKVNRARLSFIKKDDYQLSMADHNGRWEATPYTGSLDELLELLTNDFSFALIDFDDFN
ncbi:MAG: hypothetical protein ACOCQN_01290 [Halanaerobiaceae bacterium]